VVPWETDSPTLIPLRRAGRRSPEPSGEGSLIHAGAMVSLHERGSALARPVRVPEGRPDALVHVPLRAPAARWGAEHRSRGGLRRGQSRVEHPGRPPQSWVARKGSARGGAPQSPVPAVGWVCLASTEVRTAGDLTANPRTSEGRGSLIRHAARTIRSRHGMKYPVRYVKYRIRHCAKLNIITTRNQRRAAPRTVRWILVYDLPRSPPRWA